MIAPVSLRIKFNNRSHHLAPKPKCGIIQALIRASQEVTSPSEVCVSCFITTDRRWEVDHMDVRLS